MQESVYNYLPNDFLARLLSTAMNLRSLDLSPGFLISYPHIAPVVTFHRSLTTLSLAGCQAFSTSTLPQFLSFLPNLVRLDISGTSGVTPALFTVLPHLHLTAIRLRHQTFKINDDSIRHLAQTFQSNLSDLDISFALKSITEKSIEHIERYCQARPPLYSSEITEVDIGPGPRKLGLAYTSVPLAAVTRLLHSEMIHLVALDLAGISSTSSDSVEFWESLKRGGSFHTLESMRIDFPVFAANASFNITHLPSRLREFTIHNVPPVESSPPRTTRVLIMLLIDIASPNTNPFIVSSLRTLNLEMMPKADEQDLGMYALNESTSEEIDVIEELKRWKKSQKRPWQGEIRVVRDVTGVRGYAQEFGSGVGDILGRWQFE